MLDFNPRQGHEQAGRRPALVVSNDFFNKRCSMTLVCPITNTDNGFPLHIRLDNRTKTTGVVLCEHIRSVDLKARSYSNVERLPDDILRNVLDVVIAELEPS